MQINSLLFLFIFLPVALLLTLVSGKRLRNTVLLLFSLSFYVWAGVSYSLIIIFCIIINYAAGLLIQKNLFNAKAKTLLFVAICTNILVLGIFKYMFFFFENLNAVIGFFGSAPFIVKKIGMPLGISFFTFCNLSYLIDIFRKETTAEKNFINFALYISFFPRIISGPIVRYKHIQSQMTGRKITLENFASGIERFVIGLGKKVLIADTFAVVANHVFSLPASELAFVPAWIGIITYTLQLYFDFSGYSDMAIGLGRMFGFTIAENFNFPYISKSIQEFWQRWHISLSTWLRDYLFMPLSLKFRNFGSKGIALSVLITFTLCGLWHYPAWTYIVWGFIHGFFMMIERVGFGKRLKTIWKPLRHFYVVIVVLFSWVFFRSPDLNYAIKYCSGMLSFSSSSLAMQDMKQYFDNAFFISLAIAVTGSAGILTVIGNSIKNYFSHLSFTVRSIAEITCSVTEMATLFLILVISVTYLASNNYNPFIYFRF
jgi:alginate O-acetyltransferase complex protein AlgI